MINVAIDDGSSSAERAETAKRHVEEFFRKNDDGTWSCYELYNLSELLNKVLYLGDPADFGKGIHQEIPALSAKISQLVDRIMSTYGITYDQAYTRNLSQLTEAQIAGIIKEIAECGLPMQLQVAPRFRSWLQEHALPPDITRSELEKVLKERQKGK